MRFFEEVVGRKPEAHEFIAGRDAGFDLKSIRAIAGLDKVEKAASAVNPAQKESWLRAFEQTFHRQPNQQELDYAEREGFNQASLTSLAQAARASQQEQAQASQAQATQAQASQAQTQAAQTQAQATQAQPAAAQAAPFPVQPKKKNKKAFLIAGAALASFLVLAGGGYHIYATTGPKVPAKQMKKALEDKDYEQVASLLSTGGDKWTKQEAKSFVAHVEEEDINLQSQMDKFAKEGAKAQLTDNHDNKLLSLEEKGKKFGLFSEYQFKTHPVTVSLTTNLDKASLEIKDQKSIDLAKGQTTEVGEFHYADKEMVLKGKTDAGMIETPIKFSPQKSENNQLSLNLQSEKKSIRASLPNDIMEPTDIKLMVNSKEVSKNLDAELQLIPYQELEIYASFDLYGSTFTTDKKKVTVSSDENEIRVDLKLSNEVTKKVKEAAAAKKAKEEEAAKAAKEAEKQKENVKTFLSDYRSAVFSSISSRSNSYARYYDTSSSIYKEMVAWTTGGGVADAKIDYYQAGALDVKDVRAENGEIVVDTYEDYTVHYTNKKATTFTSKYKTYHLKPSGDSFVITAIDVQIITGE